MKAVRSGQLQLSNALVPNIYDWLLIFYELFFHQAGVDGEEAAVLRALHRRLPLAQEDEAGSRPGAGAGQAHRRVHRHIRAG